MNTSAHEGIQNSATHAMDRMYRWQHVFYDLTRKPYLLGRDRLIVDLKPSDGSCVLEIGCGTGRNLIAAAHMWPNAKFFGYDVSGVMVAHARKAVRRAGLEGRVSVALGDACAFDPRAAFCVKSFERIYFSYVLSMIPPWRKALSEAVSLLGPGASLHIADFGDQHGMGALSRATLNKWLSIFHVSPRIDLQAELNALACKHGLLDNCQNIYGGYAVVAALKRPAE